MVRHQMQLLAVVICLIGMVGPRDAATQESSPDTGKGAAAGRVDDLIRQLDHAEFASRQTAAKELEAIGEPALESLRKAVKSSASVETRRRAEQLVQAIEPRPVHLVSAYFSPGLPLAETKHPVHLIKIVAQVNAKGEGKGTMELILTPPNFDEYGDFVTGTEVDGKIRPQKNERPGIVLECTIEFVKAGFIGRVNRSSVNRSTFRIKGPKIVSPLQVVTQGPGLTSGRLLVLDKDERVDYVVELADLTPRPGAGGGVPIPCHPGCFPAGTLVNVPGGAKPIERIRKGDLITSIDADGKAFPVEVTDIFVTHNRLLNVQVEGARLVTTETQPIALEAGGYCAAGELKAGDRIWRWVNNERRAASVVSVLSAHRESEVFNLVLGGTKCFIAGAFLVRSKPPFVNPRPEQLQRP